MMKVVFAGGGTGGHIYPIIAITREIRKAYAGKKKLRFYYIGPKEESTLALLSQEGIRVKFIFAGKIRRYFGIKSSIQNFLDAFRTFIGIFQAFRYLFVLAPDLVFSKGGYGSFPAAFAGRILRIPIFLHESDIAPGLANRTLGKFSAEVFVSYPNTENVNVSKMFVVGNPTRKELLEATTENAHKLFKITSEKPIILILGGSQGAQRINNLILNILSQLLENFEIIHQTGPKNFKEVKAEAEVMMDKKLKKFYHPVPSLDEKELKHAYKICNFIISRAGSGIIFEIAAVSKPSILIPIPKSAQSHQVKNAYAYSKNGACMVIEEANLTSYFFLSTLKRLISDPKKLEAMQIGAKKFSKPRAGEVIAHYIVEYLIQ